MSPLLTSTRQAGVRRRWTYLIAGLVLPQIALTSIAFGYLGVHPETADTTPGLVPLLLALAVLSLLPLIGALVGVDRLLLHPLGRIASFARRAAADKDAAGETTLPVDAGDELGDCARAVRELNDARVAVDAERIAALEASELYRALVESSVEGIVTANRRGVIDFANRGLEDILGLRREEMIGHEIWRYYDGGREQARDIMKKIREHGGSIQNVQMELLGRERKTPILTSAALLRDKDGNELGTFGIFRDVSARRRLEAELKETQARLLQSLKLRALGDLVSGVAHEVNNPLMAATTIIHMLKKTIDDQACGDACANRARVDVLERCTERIARIVNHLRDFSRQTDLVRAEISLNEPVDDALLITRQQLTNMQITVDSSLADDLPPILGDRNQLEQVFLNLITNARDAITEPDKVTGRDRDGERDKQVTLRTFGTTLDGEPAVGLSITDTGPGIPPEVREKMFEPFFTTKGVGEGTGLGLSISYGIVEGHGGRIEVDDGPGGIGTTFRVLVPAAPAPGGTVETEQERPSRRDRAGEAE